MNSIACGSLRSGWALRPRPRALPPLAPLPALPPARHPSRLGLAGVASALAAGFLRPLSSVQEDETSDALITFLSPVATLPSFLAPLAPAGLCRVPEMPPASGSGALDRKSTRLNSSH